jgi:hypothetical protein
MNEQQQNSQDDINERAIEAGTTPERVQAQRTDTTPHPAQTGDAESEAAPSQVRPDHLQDGYTTSEGGNYEQDADGSQESYDPGVSGARHAIDKPGTPVEAPGREGVTGWAEQSQSGNTTDRPRKNPSW